MSRRLLAVLGLAVAILASVVFAHVRLINASNGRLLYWVDSAHIPITIASAGSDDIEGRSHQTAIQNSIASWNAASGTRAHLIEDTAEPSRARTDWAADDLHLVYFDEIGTSGYFPAGSSTVAITPVWFSSNGHITDADVLFNGHDFSFTTQNDAGAFDVQDVATHEIGHLLGLDHSGCVGASLYPYVSPGLNLHRSIASDDEHGLRDAYPSGVAGSISGTVRRASNSTAVGGAYVVARSSSGRTITSVLATNAGTFRLNGLAADDYLVYATPLDFPVSFANLIQGRIVQTDFQSTIHGIVSVATGQSVAIGDLLVGADTMLSLGRNFDPLPLGAAQNRTTILTLHGSVLQPGSTLSSGDPSITVAPLAWMGNQVIFTAIVPAASPPGHVDVIATSSAGAQSILPGAIEIVPQAPLVISITPSSASDAGGVGLTLTGMNFRSGMRVVIGDRIYEDGVVGGCTVMNSGMLGLSTAPTQGGTYDVVLIDSTGVEGRLRDGFTFTSLPGIDSIFPLAGTTLGGTTVSLQGSGFVEGSSVRIDGVDQSDIQVSGSTRLDFTTAPGLPGGPYVVEVENPGGAIATAAFSYAATPDPSLSSIDPAIASTSGAVVVTLHGDGFDPATAVVFGADPITGAGGVQADQVTFVDAQTLEVLVPAHSSGLVSVMVSHATTGQADVLPESFTYVGDGGGGGGCFAVGNVGKQSLRGVLEGSWWIALAMLAALWAARPRKSAKLAT